MTNAKYIEKLKEKRNERDRELKEISREQLALTTKFQSDMKRITNRADRSRTWWHYYQDEITRHEQDENAEQIWEMK
jgi:Skp family chaperone for outer membrane proteins